MSKWSVSKFGKKFIVILVASALLFLGYFFTRNCFVEHPVTYTIMGKTDGSSVGKNSHLEWVFSLKDSAGGFSDKYVTFSVYNRFEVGSHVTFYERNENDDIGALVRFVSVAIVIIAFIFCVIE